MRHLTRREALSGLALLFSPVLAAAAQDSEMETFLAWAKNNAHALKTSDPDDPIDDLEPLREIVGDARIVGVGESIHGGREFLRLRHRAARFLIERMGFDVVAFESGFPESRLAYDYVLGGAQPAQLWEDGFTWGFGDYSETRALVEWIRAYNARSGRRVRFYGMDVPGAKGSWRGAAEQVFGYLDKVDAAWCADMRGRLTPLLAKFERPGRTSDSFVASNDAFVKLPLAERTAVAAYVNELFDRIENLRLAYLRAAGAEDYDWARQVALNLRASSNLVTSYEARHRVHPGLIPNAREALMATNIEWMRRRGAPDGGVVVLAHNSHVLLEAPTVSDPSVAFAGTFLRERFGVGYRTIGFTFGSGTMPARGPSNLKRLPQAEPDSVDGILSRIGLPLCLINLQRLSRNDPAAQWMSVPRKQRHQDQYLLFDELKSWDGLLHVERVNASTPSAP